MKGKPRPPRQRLAKRKARKEQLVRFGFCLTSELCGTGKVVRELDRHPARAHVEAGGFWGRTV